MIIADLIYNLSILVSFSVFSGFFNSRFRRTEMPGKIIQGILFGSVAVIGMVYPYVYSSDILFDGRSIAVSLCTVFFGPVSGLISMFMASTCRIILGGEGTVPGLILILASFSAGYLFYKWNLKSNFNALTPLKLYQFGILIHVIMIIIVSISPDESFLQNYLKVTLLVLGVYPLITMITGKVLLDQERNIKYINEISENEEQYRTTLYSIGDAVITTDKEGNVQQLNLVAEQITGWKESEAKNKPLDYVFNIIHEVTRKPIENPVYKVLKGGQIVGLANHTILISKDGNEIPIADSGAPIYNNKGDINGVVLVFRDQTKERDAQKALMQSEEIFRHFMDFSPIYVYIIDREFRVVKASKNYESFFGYPVEKIIGKSIKEIYPKENVKKIIEEEETIFSEGKQLEVYDSYGGRFFRTIKFPIVLDGKIIYSAGYTIDITEAKKIEEELQESESKFREIINSIHEAIFIHEAETGMVLDVNDTMYQMYGYDSKEEAINAGFEKLSFNKPGYSFEKAFKLIRKSYEEGPQVFEWLGRKKDGSELHLEVSLKSTSIGGKGRVLAVARDISERKRTEIELREATELRKAILDNASYAIISTTEEGIIKTFNPAAERITGYSASEVINKHTPEIFHDSAEIFERAKLFSEEIGEKVNPGFEVFIAKAARGMQTNNEWTYIKKDDTRVPVFLSISALYNSDNNITGYLGIASDISEQKEADRMLKLRTVELKESEEKYRILFEQSKDAMLIIDGNLFVDCNEAAVKILRFESKEDLLNTHPSVLSPPVQPDGERSFEKAEKMMNIAKANGSHRFEWVHRKSDGEDFYVEVSLTIIPYQKKQIIHTAWRDITDRKLAEEKIIKLSKGIEQSPATIIISDKEGNIEYANPKFSEVTGYEISEVINKNMRMLKSGYHDENVYQELWDTISKGKMWKGELLNRKKNGELLWEHVSISPIRNEKGDITNFISINEDVTERKKMMGDLIDAKEKAEKANQLKSEFLAQMSHEIRSPINTMVSFTSLIEDELKDYQNDELNTCFTGIESASKRVIRTIDLILNMSELQLGTYEISERDIDLSSVLRNLIIEYTKIASLKNLELKSNVDSQKVIVKTDEYAVNQIFANLIDNAIKYTEKGKVEIAIEEKNDSNVIIKISDTGIGISSEYIGQLFEPFSQEEQGYTRKFEGNGLGMSLVKRYCDLISADISVESEKGKGTEFTILIPR